MKESISNSYIVMLVLVFITLVSFVFLSSINYSRAFKIKNKIVDIIERYKNGYEFSNRAKINEEIEQLLKETGYKLNFKSRTCPTYNGKSAINSTKNYYYCIYETDAKNDSSMADKNTGKYYYVKTFITLHIPIINSELDFSVNGETKIFNYEHDFH